MNVATDTGKDRDHRDQRHQRHAAKVDADADAAREIRPGSNASVEQAAGHQNMLQLIQLRWLAVFGQIVTITVVTLGFGIALPMPQMLSVLACLIAFNIGSHLRWHETRVASNRELFFALLVDVASLTMLLYYSGGTANPFVFLFLLQVILSAVLLEAWSTWTIVGITSACLAGLAVWARPLTLSLETESSFAALYVEGLLVCFALNASLLVVFVSRINRNVQAAAAQLASLRQRAAEQEHIVRMGLLASGAAHELGTPLATLSVILGDWKRMPEFSGNPELLEELGEMQAQLARCKSIVSGILLSAGETRGESSARASIRDYLDQLVDEWKSSRQAANFEYINDIARDLPAVFDSTVKQTISNLLDNALEASPHWLKLEARREDGWLKLTVTDAGSGFGPGMLERFGEPYQSSKGRPGRGLGLFLAVNVARTLGGRLAGRNRPEGGAEVELVLPLAAIALEEEQEHDRHAGARSTPTADH
jgi:two-component system sensor histidine kinase RegB